MELSVLILAAGKGTRMKSVLPKVMQPLAARPLLAHVLQTARDLQSVHTLVVYGHGGDVVRQHFAGEPEAAKQLSSDPLGPLDSPVQEIELAAWTSVCNVLLNLDEVLMKR